MWHAIINRLTNCYPAASCSRAIINRLTTLVQPAPLAPLQGTEHKYAMKTLDKWEMQERNKVARVLTEQGILTKVDHPFLATLYCTIQVRRNGFCL